MKAAVLVEAGKPLVIEDVMISKPGPHEVLIRTAACGLCHSDLHFIEGIYPHPLPAIPGHEAAKFALSRSAMRWSLACLPIVAIASFVCPAACHCASAQTHGAALTKLRGSPGPTDRPSDRCSISRPSPSRC